jgi:hypothetical protein
MSSTLRSRLERLEAQRRAAAVATTRYAFVSRLPDDFVGARHIVMVENAAPSGEWAHFEERPGPGPNEADGAHVIYLSETDRRI